MSRTPINPASTTPTRHRIEPRIIDGVNWVGLSTLIRKETERFFKVWLQTIVAPVITTVLFYLIFSLSFGDAGRGLEGVPYMTFLMPGLVMMGVLQNAFANTSSSLIMMKIQGSIVDVLMPPLSASELLLGLTIGGIIRGLVVGAACVAVLVPFAHLPIAHLWAIIAYGVLGSALLSLIGVLAGLWAEKFDHLASVTNFVIMPLSMLSGTFYAVKHLPDAWEQAARYNPFFYVIDGFRYGFIGTASMPLLTGLVFLVALCLAFWWICLHLIKIGYKIRS